MSTLAARPAGVVASLTARTLLGRRRAAVLLALPLVVLVLAVVVRLVAGRDVDAASTLLGGLALGTLVPLVGVVLGTGAIGPELEDGSIVYLLAKPVDRRQIVLAKLAVAVAAGLAFAALPVLLAGLVLVGGEGDLAVSAAVAAAAAVTAYCALFLLLAVVTRNAVVVGLLYALLWEGTVAGLVPGARALSVRQWAAAIGERVGDGVSSEVSLTTGVVLLVVVTVGAVELATRRLRGLSLTGEQ